MTQFGLCLPEIMLMFDTLETYFCWFYITNTQVKEAALPLHIKISILESIWIDGLDRKIKVRRQAMREILPF